ncbi:MAG TPA: hypothetical protein VJ749_08760 [Pyrinomonadaceae bacterium]|nr:hypothetical protein [Pyrinomonadaceae bacterium]
MRLALFATTLVLLTLLACDTARACECVPLSSSESFKNADVVFEGELLDIAGLPPGSRFPLSYRFKVHKSLKGGIGRFVNVFGDGSDCDSYFAPGFIYRVYAKDVNGMFTSGSCSGNEIIGAATVVARTFTYAPPRINWQRLFMNTLAICGFGVLLGSGVFVWRRYLRS